MGRLFSRRKYRDLMLGLALLCAVLALMRWPQESMAAARDGLALCGNVIIPSLFPFFVLSSLVVELGMSRYLGRLLEGVMAPLFRVGGACSSALALGFVGGYPVGARTAIALYENGQCSKTEAERLLAFCNNSGPAFILGVVGTGIFASSRAGLLLYLAHIAASLCVGLLFRFYRPGEGPRPGRHAAPQFQAASFPVAFTHSITGALSSTLNICAFVLFFTVVIRMLFLSGVMGALAGGTAALLSPLGLDQAWAQRLITGLFECLYHSHPIRSDIAGTVESIAEITPEMLYDCCKAFYAPGNMVLAAAGNTSMEQILAACARHGLMDEHPAEKVERLLRPEPMTLAAAEKTIAMPIAKSCFGLGFKEEPLPFGDLRSEMLYELILCCICGGMSPLYRRLYDEGLTNPGFGGEVLRVDGCCCILFTGESDRPDTVRQLLLDEIERVRKEGVDREIFTLCKNEKYGQLIENLENVEDSASQMADFALAGQTVAQQITMLAGLTAEDADAALQHILRPERMAVMYIEPDGTAVEDEEEEETEE